MEINKESIAKVIKNKRQEANLTQLELAEKIGISEKHMSKIETGKNYPPLETFLKLLDTLNITLGDFGFTNLDNKTSPKKILLQKIIDNSSEKQLDACAEVVVALMKHI